MNSLKGKNVLVLGAAGFLGNHLCDELRFADANVAGVDNFSRGRRSPRQVDVYHADILTTGGIMNPALQLPWDIVINLAAHVAGIDYNINHQLEMLARNTELQVRPIQWARQLGVKTFLQVSSVCVYDPSVQEDAPASGVVEVMGLVGTPQEANKGYAWAKRFGEIAMTVSGFDSWYVVRPSNMIGPGDYFDDRAHVVPALIKRAVNEPTMKVYGNEKYVREFVDVRDVARGIIRVLTHGKNYAVYNIGSGVAITIGDLARAIRNLVDKDKTIEFISSEGGDPFRLSNSAKIRALGWEPEHDMGQTLFDTINYYLKDVAHAR